jgi:hypothetical protein
MRHCSCKGNAAGISSIQSRTVARETAEGDVTEEVKWDRYSRSRGSRERKKCAAGRKDPARRGIRIWGCGDYRMRGFETSTLAHDMVSSAQLVLELGLT